METSLPMNSGTYGTSFFDSIILQIKDSKQQVTIGQDSLDFGCLKVATYTGYEPGVSKKKECSQKTKLVEFAVV